MTRVTAWLGATLALLLAPGCAEGDGQAGGASSRAIAGKSGELISFMRPGRLGEYDLWAVRPDGSGLRRLTTTPLNRSDYNPSRSPEGSKVLFERSGGDGDDLYTVGVDGRGLERLTDCSLSRDGCFSDGEARWSPDGARIAAQRALGSNPNAGPTDIAIWLIGADGTYERRLSSPPEGLEDHNPTWSPDGRTIVFERDSTNDVTARSRLVAVSVESGAERLVYKLPKFAPSAGDPRFSPDGKRILFGFWCAFGDQCPASTPSARNATLATIRPNGKGLRKLRLPSGADSGTWSPNGKRIVYRCRADGGASVAPGDARLCTSKLNGRAFKEFPYKLDSASPDWGLPRR